MFNASISTIPHQAQRYETCGDWGITRPPTVPGCVNIDVRVSSLGDWKMEALVAIHELIEATLCTALHIDPGEVDSFDMRFEAEREPEDNSEPGDDVLAPYYVPHQIATGVERTLAALLGVPWSRYEKTILDLPPVRNKA